MNRRLTERSLLHICNTFLNILTASNNAAFCITPTLHVTIWQFFVALARAPIMTSTITTILSFCNLPISLQFLVLFHFFFWYSTLVDYCLLFFIDNYSYVRSSWLYHIVTLNIYIPYHFHFFIIYFSL